MPRKPVVSGIAPAERPGGPVSGALSAGQTEVVRDRVRLIIEITAREGAYRRGLLAAAEHLSPEEAAIISDLERNGLQVAQLHDVLCGGHVLIDDPRLYEDWALTHYSTQGSAKIAGASTDLVLARHQGRLHLFSRDQDNPAKLVTGQWKGGNVQDTLASLLT